MVITLIGNVQSTIAKGTDWLVESNEVKRLGTHVIKTDADADYAVFSGRNITFRYNFFHGTRQSETGSSHVDGFQHYSSSSVTDNVLIENNIVEGFHEGLMLEGNGFTTPVNLRIRNNIFLGTPAFDRSYGIIAQDVPNLTVVNNLFARLLDFGVLFEADGGPGTRGVIKNNIFFQAGDQFDYKGVGGWSSVDGGYNLIYLSGQSSPVDVDDVFEEDPLFERPHSFLGPDRAPFTADDGFRLRRGSPAIDSGIDLGVPYDLDGMPRPQGTASDIGPYEY